MAYATEGEVEVLVGDVVNSRNFTDSTVPTTSQVALFITQRDALLDNALSMVGYSTPVTLAADPNAYNLLVHASSCGVASDVMAAFFPMMSFAEGGEPIGRYAHFRSTFDAAVKLIRSGGLSASISATSRIFTGSQENSDGETKQPLFKRGIFDYPGSRILSE